MGIPAGAVDGLVTTNSTSGMSGSQHSRPCENIEGKVKAILGSADRRRLAYPKIDAAYLTDYRTSRFVFVTLSWGRGRKRRPARGSGHGNRHTPSRADMGLNLCAA